MRVLAILQELSEAAMAANLICRQSHRGQVQRFCVSPGSAPPSVINQGRGEASANSSAAS